MFAIISLFSQSFDDIGFTYKIPQELISTLNVWMIVLVPFGKKTTFWVVLDISENTNFEINKIKEITNIYSKDIFLNHNQIKLLTWISKNYFTLIHSSTNLFFPKNLIWKIEKNKFQIDKELKDLNYTFDYKKILNTSQKEVYEKIINSKNNKFLLYWVTWSWKTEIYINLIKHYLDNNKQVLLLVPEIILTNQIFERIKSVFWSEVLVLNSTVSEAKKTKYWELIHQNKAKIVIWTRLSLFYPYNNLWLIIIDEEHDNSYISDNTPRYDGVDVALKISELNDTKILLASWTPKVNHLYNFLKWWNEVLNLFNEYEN